jgi:hypothetical protein
MTITDNPGGHFLEVIDFLYTGTLHFRRDSIVDFLKIAEIYRIPSLHSVAHAQFEAARAADPNQETLLLFADRLVYHGVSEISRELAAPIAAEVLKIVNSQPSRCTLAAIFAAVDSKLLACVLREIPTMSVPAMVALVDSFVDAKGPAPPDPDLSAAVGDWNDAGSYRLLVSHRCDWVVPALTRRHYSAILSNRRRAIAQLAECAERAAPGRAVGRWHPLSWLDVIQRAEIGPPILPDVIGFARTLGCVPSGIDAVAFGLIKATSSPPISNRFAAKFALLPGGGHFLSVTHGGEVPWMEISFGRGSNVAIDAITIRTEVRWRKPSEVVLPEVLEVLGRRGRKWVTLVPEANLRPKVKANAEKDGSVVLEGTFAVAVDPDEDRFNKIKIQQKSAKSSDDPLAYRFTVLRLLRVAFRGRFDLRKKP